MVVLAVLVMVVPMEADSWRRASTEAVSWSAAVWLPSHSPGLGLPSHSPCDMPSMLSTRTPRSRACNQLGLGSGSGSGSGSGL
eukprot:scaffold6202_cov43-Phaeocystis_antarctica.AAC.1